MTDRAIKTMKLYHQVERVFKELSALGIRDSDPIPIEELVAHDQYHYLGTDSVDEAIDKLALDATKHVLEVGAGIGGPADSPPRRRSTVRPGAAAGLLQARSAALAGRPD